MSSQSLQFHTATVHPKIESETGTGILSLVLRKEGDNNRYEYSGLTSLRNMQKHTNNAIAMKKFSATMLENVVQVDKPITF